MRGLAVGDDGLRSQAARDEMVFFSKTLTPGSAVFMPKPLT
jgi:hypothetical protein